MTHSSSNTREKFGGMTPEIDRLLVKGYKAKLKETKPSQKKPVDNCCECYCEKCRDCYRQPCKIHKPSHYTGTPTTTSTGTYFPSQKEVEGWVRELYMLIGRFDSTTGYYLGLKEFDIYLIISFIKSLLKEQEDVFEERRTEWAFKTVDEINKAVIKERERIKKEMLKVIYKI